MPRQSSGLAKGAADRFTSDTPPAHHAAAHQYRLSPHDRKAGGVYYTPDDIVAWMVANSLGRLVAGKSPDEILALRIIDTSCGAGAFLIGAFDYLMQALLAIYRARPGQAGERRVEICDGELRLTMRHKREILGQCIYGVDIDPQAVEVARCHCIAGWMRRRSAHRFSR